MLCELQSLASSVAPAGESRPLLPAVPNHFLEREHPRDKIGRRTGPVKSPHTPRATRAHVMHVVGVNKKNTTVQRRKTSTHHALLPAVPNHFLERERQSENIGLRSEFARFQLSITAQRRPCSAKTLPLHHTQVACSQVTPVKWYLLRFRCL